MTRYLNPPDMPKEQWLLENAEWIGEVAPESYIRENHTLAALVSNGFFTAAGLCEDDRDFRDFTNPSDTRPKLWWWVPNDKTGAFK